MSFIFPLMYFILYEMVNLYFFKKKKNKRPAQSQTEYESMRNTALIFAGINTIMDGKVCLIYFLGVK